MSAESSRALVAAPQRVQVDIVTAVKAYEAGRDPKYLEIAILIKNGLYYQSVNNPVSALVSYSNAATYLHAVGDTSPVLSTLLGYIEALQEKVRGLGVGGKKEDDESNWDSLCVNMCELDSNSLCLTFADVVGMQKEKNLMEVNIIKPLIYKNLYTKSSKGVLLYGPPGTGKTYLVKAAIRELQNRFSDQVQVLFFSKTGADLKGKYVGETEKRIVEVYTCAARRACEMTDFEAKVKGCAAKTKEEQLEKYRDVVKKPQYVSVIFIDEFDSIGRDRSADETGLAANAVNTLLQMMDGVESYKNVITIAATNNPWDLDAALLRRFNEHIYVKLPKFDDIKTLVKREMEDRFKLVETDLASYCGTTVADPKKRVYKPSKDFLDTYGKKGAGKKDPCGKTEKTTFPLSAIDIAYQNDTSEEMLAAISEMAEKHYSNSDVSSVMQKAFNNVSEKCLQLGAWKKINGDVINKKVQPGGTVIDVTTKHTYYVSNFTKLDKSYPDNKLYEDANAAIESQASTLTDYDKDSPSNAIDYSKHPLFFDINEYIKQDPFDIANAYTKEKRQRAVANIVYNGATYINLKFMSNPQTYLLFNDNSICDIFFNKSQLDKPITSDTTLDVLFTRVMSVTNGEESLEKKTNDVIVNLTRDINSINRVLNLEESQLLLLAKAYDSGMEGDDFLDMMLSPIQTMLGDNQHYYEKQFGNPSETITESQINFFYYTPGIWDPIHTWHTELPFPDLISALRTIKGALTLVASDIKRSSEVIPTTVRKLFFFKSQIKPLSGDWSRFRTNSSAIGAGLKGIWGWLTSLIYTKEETKDKLAASYISEARVSALDYLLARATHVGISKGATDSQNIYGDKTTTTVVSVKGGSRKHRNKRNNTFRALRKSRSTKYTHEDLIDNTQYGGANADNYKINWFEINSDTKLFGSSYWREMFTYRIPSTLKLISGFEKEADMRVQQVIVKAMFSSEYFYINGKMDELNSISNQTTFSNIFMHNYKKSLKQQNYNFWPSAAEVHPPTLTELASMYNVKQIITSNETPDYNTFLSFYVDGSFLSGAIAEYPSTYNKKIVNMLNIYDSNRADFYARRDKGEFDKKK